MLALDHEDSFRKLINPRNPEQVYPSDIIELKRGLIGSLLSRMSGLLIDSEYGLPAYEGAIKKTLHQPPYLLRVEQSGYEGATDERYTKIIFKAKDVKEKGAQGVKLLLYFNPFSKSAEKQLAVAKEVLADAHAAEMPLFIEIVTYEVEGYTKSRGELILSSMDAFIEKEVIPDVWKLEFPEGDPYVCKEMNTKAGNVPWILLTRGVSFDIFKEQFKTAVEAGAQGFLAGRALWQEAGGCEPAEREVFFRETLPRRFDEITSLILHKEPAQ